VGNFEEVYSQKTPTSAKKENNADLEILQRCSGGAAS